MCEKKLKIVEFATIDLPVTATEGIPISSVGGKCAGVRLQLPAFVRNSETQTQVAAAARLIYYGDRSSQEWELNAVLTKDNFTPFLPCEDLKDIYIRGIGTRVLVQVIVYDEI